MLNKEFCLLAYPAADTDQGRLLPYMNIQLFTNMHEYTTLHQYASLDLFDNDEAVVSSAQSIQPVSEASCAAHFSKRPEATEGGVGSRLITDIDTHTYIHDMDTHAHTHTQTRTRTHTWIHTHTHKETDTESPSHTQKNRNSIYWHMHDNIRKVYETERESYIFSSTGKYPLIHQSPTKQLRGMWHQKLLQVSRFPPSLWSSLLSDIWQDENKIQFQSFSDTHRQINKQTQTQTWCHDTKPENPH